MAMEINFHEVVGEKQFSNQNHDPLVHLDIATS